MIAPRPVASNLLLARATAISVIPYLAMAAVVVLALGLPLGLLSVQTAALGLTLSALVSLLAFQPLAPPARPISVVVALPTGAAPWRRAA